MISLVHQLNFVTVRRLNQLSDKTYDRSRRNQFKIMELMILGYRLILDIINGVIQFSIQYTAVPLSILDLQAYQTI